MFEGEYPVKDWLERLAAGDQRAAQPLWDHYFRRLVRLAGSRLPDHTRRAYDEEDVALSAMRSFCERAGRGQFPQLSDPDDLWRLLVVMTARKAIGYLRSENRLKRGGGRVQGESIFAGLDEVDTPRGLDGMTAEGPTPELAALLAEESERLLAELGGDDLRAIARLKLEGYIPEEIAARLGMSKRSVDRKLRIIRMTWTEAAKLSRTEGARP
jgi:DNA-directed RNA polymerase specialized sigma24 family protein